MNPVLLLPIFHVLLLLQYSHVNQMQGIIAKWYLKYNV